MSVRIGLSMAAFPFSSPAGMWRWVEACEDSKVDSIWQTDRLISKSPILECMTALAAIAGRTREVKFGVNVVSVAMRDPVLLAKQCATIDVLSEGRLLPGFGIGSPRALLACVKMGYGLFDCALPTRDARRGRPQRRAQSITGIQVPARGDGELHERLSPGGRSRNAPAVSVYAPSR